MKRGPGDKSERGFVALPDLIGGGGSLARLLSERGVSAVEIPCIAFQPTDVGLDSIITEEDWEFVVISAPEAASIFAGAWVAAGRPAVAVACVGEKTRRELENRGLNSTAFAITAASGQDLAARARRTRTGRVLLPVSLRARTDMQEALEERGFSVRRVDVYDTVSVAWSDLQLSEAAQCSVVALASPSAIEVWAHRVGTRQHAVCFGESSAEGCRRAGFRRVSFPKQKGLQGWADECARAIEQSDEM
jgi:uroporphyrinogen-III synthase